MNEQPKVYSVTKNGEHRGIYQEPGNCARAVEEILGYKARGRGNIVPMIAKLGVGKRLDLDDGVKVFRVRPVEEPQEREEKEPPAEEQAGVFIIRQDPTGGRTLTWDHEPAEPLDSGVNETEVPEAEKPAEEGKE